MSGGWRRGRGTEVLAASLTSCSSSASSSLERESRSVWERGGSTCSSAASALRDPCVSSARVRCAVRSSCLALGSTDCVDACGGVRGCVCVLASCLPSYLFPCVESYQPRTGSLGARAESQAQKREAVKKAPASCAELLSATLHSRSRLPSDRPTVATRLSRDARHSGASPPVAPTAAAAAALDQEERSGESEDTRCQREQSSQAVMGDAMQVRN